MHIQKSKFSNLPLINNSSIKTSSSSNESTKKTSNDGKGASLSMNSSIFREIRNFHIFDCIRRCSTQDSAGFSLPIFLLPISHHSHFSPSHEFLLALLACSNALRFIQHSRLSDLSLFIPIKIPKKSLWRRQSEFSEGLKHARRSTE